MTVEPTNKRMSRLENAAAKTARMLVKRPDVNVVVGAMPAYAWRTKTLSLPAYSKVADDPRLETAWRGLMDHECSHVEFTDFEAVDKKLVEWEAEHGKENVQHLMSLTNVFEDIWIEKDWADKYPGARRHLEVKNEYVVEKTGGAGPCDPQYRYEDDDGNKGRPIGLWGALLQSVLRVARGNVQPEEVSEDVQRLMALCREEILKGWAAKSTADAIVGAEGVFAAVKAIAEARDEDEDEDEDEGEAGEAAGEAAGAGEGEGEGGEAAGDAGEGEGEGEGEGGEGEGEGEGGEGEGAGAGEGEGEGAGAGEGEGEGGEGEGAGAGAEPGGGAGMSLTSDRELAAEAMGGEWGDVKSDAEVIANKYIEEMPPLYTIHPDSAAKDKVITYDQRLREAGRAKLNLLEQAAGPAASKLMGLLRGAVQASRTSLVIGGMEEGEGLDEAALAGIALGLNDPAIFTRTITEITESTFVGILVDCSGSMDSSTPTRWCEKHGRQGSRSECGTCSQPTKVRVTTKAGYAAITAMALHKSLQACRIPHAALGYQTTRGPGGAISNPTMKNGYMRWSRLRNAHQMHVFVPAPGIYDDGAALPYITGGGCNFDGESVMWAANYCAKHGGQYDRVILLVIADGLPAGADDYRIEGPHLRKTVEEVAQAGIEVYGIGVCIGNMTTFREYYPERRASRGRAPTGSIGIKAGKGLTDSVLRQLTAMLTRGYGMSRRGRR